MKRVTLQNGRVLDVHENGVQDIKVVGISFGERQSLAADLQVGDYLVVQPALCNPYHYEQSR